MPAKVVETKLVPYREQLFCDQCHDMEMVAEGQVLLSMPPLYPHKCTMCGHTENREAKYPRIVYKEE